MAQVRDPYILLGTDTKGADHIYRTKDESVVVVQEDKSIDVYDLQGYPIDHYVRYVRDGMDDLDWESRRYITDDENVFDELGKVIARSIEGSSASS